MVLGSSAEGAPHAQRTLFRVRRANQSIKEAVGKHSDAEIISLPLRKDMDFDDSEHRFLNQDPIYEARWRNRKNGNTGYRGLADTRKFTEHKVQRTLIHTSLDHNGRKGGYARKSGPVVTQKYRIVSDNRSNPYSDTNVNPESAQNSDNSSKQVAGDVVDSGNFVERVISPISEGQIDSHQGHASLEFSLGDGQLIPELKMPASSLSTTDEGCITNEKEVVSSTLVSATMAIGMYSSATDPVHVPSADSRSAGAIGAPRRHVGVVGSQRQTCNHPSTRTSVANATLSNMEWRPKSSQKSRISSPSSQVEADDLSERVTQVNILDGGCVITPKHLEVPEAEQVHLTFGSFGDGFDLNSKSVTFLKCENDDRSSDKPSMRQSVPVPVGSPKNISAVAKVDLASSNIASPQSNSSPSSAESEQALPVHSDSSSPKDIHSYADINMVLSHNPLFSPFKPQQSESSPSMQYFLGYGQQAARDCAPFSTAVIDENPHLSLSSTSETLALNATCNIRQSSVTMAQQQQQLPPVSQLYPQVHIPHFTNLAPYQHMMAPMYVPPMAMPNYSGNPAYLPSQNGSSCLFMQGGNSNVAVGGLKYTAQQYKPVHAGNPVGYASFACPAGYTIGTVGTVGAANANDIPGFKFIDSDLYAPNLQVDALPRELAGVHHSPYDLLGQGAMTHAAYVPTHTGRAFHGGAHSSYLQYPSGLYHPSLPGSVPHHLARQQVPLPGAGAAVAAHIDPAGTYQQPQLGPGDLACQFLNKMWHSM